jgi:hypothetical protein
MAENPTTDDDDWNPCAGHPGEVRITHEMMAAGMMTLAEEIGFGSTNEHREALALAFRAMWIAKQEQDSG